MHFSLDKSVEIWYNTGMVREIIISSTGKVWSDGVKIHFQYHELERAAVMKAFYKLAKEYK